MMVFVPQNSLPFEKIALQSRKDYHRRIDRIFEILTWLMAILVIVLARIFYKEDVEIAPALLLAFTIFLIGLIFYRILPKERIQGRVIYSFEDRSLLIGLSITITAAFLIFISGGITSPFFFFYFLIIIILTVVLPPSHLLVELFGATALILLTALLYSQASPRLLAGQLIPFFGIGIFTLWFSWIIKSHRDKLEKANRDLARLNELKSDFISLSFNQMRDPLTALRWFLHDRVLVGSDLGKTQRTFFYQTYEHILKIISLLNNLRDLAYVESGEKAEKTFSKVNIVKVIEDVYGGYKAIIEWKELDFVFHKSRKDVVIHNVSVEQISHVFQTLLFNAILYNHRKGEVVVRAEKNEKSVSVSVKDTGYGTREEEKDKVFSKFFRGEDAKRINPSGAGIGLYVAKKIIEGHGGKIWFESEHGKETTFHFMLPTQVDRNLPHHIY